MSHYFWKLGFALTLVYQFFLFRYIAPGNEVKKKCRSLRTVFCILGRGNKLIIDESALLYNVEIRIIGNNNTLYISKDITLWGGSIDINGNDNNVSLAKEDHFFESEFEVKGDKNNITIGEACRSFSMKVFAHNGTTVTIGEKCLFSENVDIRTTDSHSILDSEKNRINPDKNVIIGDRVWLGHSVKVLKGAEIADDVAVGCMSIVAKKIPNNSVAVGAPARVVRSDTTWDIESL